MNVFKPLEKQMKTLFAAALVLLPVAALSVPASAQDASVSSADQANSDTNGIYFFYDNLNDAPQSLVSRDSLRDRDGRN